MHEFWAVLGLAALPAAGNFAGGLLSETIEVSRKMLSLALHAAPWAIYFGVAVDLFSDGIMIGTGSTLAFSLALLLALAQVPADVPEGFATIAAFKNCGIRRGRRLIISASFAIPIFLGATLGYWAVRGQPEVVKLSLLSFTAGILLSVVIEEMVPEAHKDGEARLAALALVGGFTLFAVISVYFGG